MNIKDKRTVKASFRACPIEDRQHFHQSSCLLPISVGQPVHEGKKFDATVTLINRSFDSCVILIDDTIQRHTLKISDATSSDKELYEIARRLGDDWLERNAKIYQRLRIPYRIIRWDKWLYHHQYPKQHQRVVREYEQNHDFQQAFDRNIDEYLNRSQGRYHTNENYRRAFGLCLTYLLEECAGMCLWAEAGYDFEVYPSGRNSSMAATYEYLIKPQYPDCIRPVALRFKKYPSHRPLMEVDRYEQSREMASHN